MLPTILGPLALILFMLAGDTVDPEAADPGGKRHTDERNGFSIWFPDTWRVRKRPDELSGLFLPKGETEYPLKVTVRTSSFDPPQTVEELAASYRKLLEEKMTDFELLEEEVVTIDYRQGKRLVFTHRIQNVATQVMLDLVVSPEGTFEISSAAPVARFVGHRPLFDRIVKSLRFEFVRTRLRHAPGRFSIVVHDDWPRTESDRVLVCRSPQEDATLRVEVVETRSDSTLESLLEERKTELEREWKSLRVQSETRGKIGELPALALSFAGVLPPDVEVRGRLTCVRFEGRGFAILAFSRSKTWESNRDELRRLEQSLRPEK